MIPERYPSQGFLYINKFGGQKCYIRDTDIITKSSILVNNSVGEITVRRE